MSEPWQVLAYGGGSRSHPAGVHDIAEPSRGADPGGRYPREACPRIAEFYGDLFDHVAEDAWPTGRPA
ncbi:hypothetical protein [Streptomyces europaeiscabiei]|uniref:hypothetical protein n=1 Tax=Streptomyces europaeiscabiei TaxID=146819 RepID=UPI000E694085|nr:hypothetical protein [Streptomyces europaeiscabiei]